jgi:hypothetical protein
VCACFIGSGPFRLYFLFISLKIGFSQPKRYFLFLAGCFFASQRRRVRKVWRFVSRESDPLLRAAFIFSWRPLRRCEAIEFFGISLHHTEYRAVLQIFRIVVKPWGPVGDAGRRDNFLK